jgi:RHS repeat-associated protein
MRKCLLFLGFFQLVLLGNTSAQNIPNGATGPTAKTPVKTSLPPDASPFYQRVFTPNMPTTDSTQVNLSATVDNVGTVTQYIDGLGRPLETVAKQASPSKKDLVTVQAFDGFNNASYQYLPYAAQSGNYNDGLVKTNPLKDDSAFYASQFSNENIYYGQTLFDASPLNRITKQMAPGNDWTGSNRGISDTMRTNTAADSVRKWVINISSEDDVPTTTTTCNNGSLYITEVTDERGYKTVSYIDELGHTILTKSDTITTAYAGHTGWLCTYYVYDEMGHLRFVIPPAATSFLLANSWSLSTHSDVVSNLCFSYWYDGRGRVTEKHIAGKGKTYIAYDLYDRVVMTQDENLRTTSQWAFIKYDNQSRPDTSGLITMTGLTAAQVIANAAASKDYPALTGTYSVLTVSFYDDYSWISGTIPSGTLTTTNINSTNFITTYNTSPYYAQQITQSNRIRGFATGTKKVVLGSSTYLYSVNIYDEKSRLIQTKQLNYTGGTDIATMQFDFSGKVLRGHLQHQKLGANTVNHTLLTKYTYDHVGRLTALSKNIDGLGDKTTLQCTYNELGQLSVKALGQLESQNLTYNIRGWLNGINKSYVETAGSTSNYFGEEIFYDFGFSSVLYNGDIAGIKWKSTGDDIQRAYGYSYDAVNRLTKADFTQQNPGSTSWTSDKMNFSVSNLKYDANGNITTMSQRGVNVSTPTLIDSLAYTYFTNSNQLQKVKDNVTDMTDWGDFKDSTSTTDDYVYDENGNLVKDNNKHIHTASGGNGISFNFLDKPDSIQVNARGTIAYTYDVSGALLQKTITNSKTNIKTVITYIAGFVYQKTLASSGNASTVPDSIQYVLHEGGRIRWSYTQSHTAGYFVYDYFLKDHLGNIRSVITDEHDTSFYPVASLETATIANEKLYYTGLDSGVVLRTSVTGYPSNDTYTSPNNYIQKLSGSGIKIGAGILLKVMAGDTINVHASSWFASGQGSPGTPVSPVNDIISAIAGSLPAVSGNKFVQSQLGSTVLSPSVTGFLNTRDSAGNSTLPKSYLNIVVLDEQLNPVITNDGNNSYFTQAGSAGSSSVIQYNPSRPITKNGYVYIYVSNETPNINVYWDNLQVTHLHGHLLQEEGYYPFGLEMKAVSSQAAMKMQTRYKFNAGTELEDNFNVDYYETAAREYDAQIGRFTGIDAMSEKTMALTTYQFGGNNPVSFNDPSGLLLKKREDIYDSYGNWNWNDVENSFAELDSYDREMGIGFPQDLSGGYSGYTEEGLVHGINEGLNSAFGGKVAANGSFTPFGSDEQALNAGIDYMNLNHAWNTNGWALNAIDARSKFNLSLIGIDANNLNSIANSTNNRGGTGIGIGIERFDENRPDDDGYLTLAEANEWYRNGNGQPLTVILSKIDLSNLTVADFPNGVSSKPVWLNLLFYSASTNDFEVYGKMGFILESIDNSTGYGVIQAVPNRYDFNMEWSPTNWIRDIETIIAHVHAGLGTPYTIYFSGTATIAPYHQLIY